MSSCYAAWLRFAFDRPESDQGWYFDPTFEPFRAGDAELVELFTQTMLGSGSDLAKYSDTQVAYGLNYAFSNACSDVPFACRSVGVPLAVRLRGIDSIRSLYTDCFEVRCAPVRSHRDEVGGSKLNGVCYMLWDTTPLSWWTNVPDAATLYRAVVDVLRSVLDLRNPACIESALHGLGHLFHSVPDLVRGVFRQVGGPSRFRRVGLEEYAGKAQVGHVQ
jgi:hypothetical protein